jgi:hypothetical protein
MPYLHCTASVTSSSKLSAVSFAARGRKMLKLGLTLAATSTPTSSRALTKDLTCCWPSCCTAGRLQDNSAVQYSTAQYSTVQYSSLVACEGPRLP